MIPNAPAMFDFGLGEEADMLRDTVARFTADELTPIAADIDTDNEFPEALWRKHHHVHQSTPQQFQQVPSQFSVGMLWGSACGFFVCLFVCPYVCLFVCLFCVCVWVCECVAQHAVTPRRN